MRPKKLEQKRAAIQNLTAVVGSYINTLADRMSKRTGLSQEFCTKLVTRQLAKQKGIRLPVENPQE